MTKPVRRFAPSAALLGLFLATLVRCGSSETMGVDGSLVRLHLVGVDPAATHVVLAVTATPPSGAPKNGTMDFASAPFDTLGVTFPPGAVATTQYQVNVYDSANCLLASGSATLPLTSDGTFEVTVQLSPVPLCGNGATLTVQVVSGVGGAGTVTSSPAGITCTGSEQSCTYMFMKNAQVTLHAAPSKGGFSGWSGAPGCSGIGDCTVTLGQDMQTVQAIFTSCHGWCQETQPAGSAVNLLGISGTGIDNVVIGGDKGTVLRWDGQSWQQQTTTAGSTIALRAVFAKPNATKLYVAGDVGTILQLSGGTWSSIANSNTNTLRAIAIGASSNVYFVGDAGTLLSVSATGTTASNKTSNLGAANTTMLNGISQNPGNGNDDLYIGGSGGYAVAWDGNTGVSVQSKNGGGNILGGSVNAMLCGGSAHTAVGDAGGISRRSSSSGNSTKWAITTPAPTAQNLRGLWASSDTNIYAVGDGGTILQFDGNTWTAVKVTNQPTFSTNLHAVWGTSKDNVYAVGDGGTILHYLP